LQERGINVQKFLEEAKNLITEFDKKDRLAWMEIADQKKQAIEKAQTSIISWIGSSLPSEIIEV